MRPHSVTDTEWRLQFAAAEAAMEKRRDMVERSSTMKARPVDTRRFNEEVALLAEIFNDAWSKNWGFVPFTPRAIALLAAELRAIYRSSYGYFVEDDGKAVGTLITIPNLNEVIKPFRGRLTPLNAARLAWALMREKVTTIRIPLAGIRKSHQGALSGALVFAALVRQVVLEARRTPKQWFEFSWVLETNRPAIAALRQLGANPISTYRIYEKRI